MTVPAARRDPRLRRFPLRRLRLPMAGGNLSIVVPVEGESVHEAARRWAARRSAANRSAPGRTGEGRRGDGPAPGHGEPPLREPPYWASVWPAAVAVARWLARSRCCSGRTALDLGCGLGVAGAAARRGGAAVTFADCNPDALAFAAFNAAQQGAGAARVATIELDWHRATVDGSFDLMLLADVSYRPAHHPPLLRHLRQCLRPGGLGVHADPMRRQSDGFLVQLRREFAVRETALDTHFDGARLPVRMAFVAHDDMALARWLGAADARPDGIRPDAVRIDRDGAGPATVAR